MGKGSSLEPPGLQAEAVPSAALTIIPLNQPKPANALAAAAAALREEVDAALALREQAVRRAFHIGLILIEIKPLVGHGNFQPWIKANVPRLPFRTAQRWMDLAERIIGHVGIQPKLLPAPVSVIMDAAPQSLAEPARHAQQLVFAFIADKTIAECLRAVVVDGEEAHRITRAHNGKTKGGTKGENRKDWAKFIGKKLHDITAHLKNWKSFTGAQTETVESKFKSALSNWPTPLLEALKKEITAELKSR